MPLSSDDVTAIILEVATGRPAGVSGPEADALREAVRADRERLRAAGAVLQVPSEWPDAAGIPLDDQHGRS